MQLEHCHLKEHHRNVYSALPALDKRNRPPPTQRTLTETLSSVQKIPTSSPKWNKLTESVCYFVAKDMQPLDTVDDSGFRHLLKTFEPRYDPPSRKTITTKYLPEMYDAERQKIKNEVSQTVSFALILLRMDFRANHAYTGVTIHFIDNSFTMKHYILQTKEFPETHSAANIAHELQEILSEWNLVECNLSRDNGRNISAAVRDLGWPSLPCFSHTLQLGVEKVLKLPQVVKAITHCKRIATHFHHSSKSSYILKQKQNSLGHKELCIIQEVPTRWNSSYYMVQGILQQQQPLCATLLEIH